MQKNLLIKFKAEEIKPKWGFKKLKSNFKRIFLILHYNFKLMNYALSYKHMKTKHLKVNISKLDQDGDTKAIQCFKFFLLSKSSIIARLKKKDGSFT